MKQLLGLYSKARECILVLGNNIDKIIQRGCYLLALPYVIITMNIYYLSIMKERLELLNGKNKKKEHVL